MYLIKYYFTLLFMYILMFIYFLFLQYTAVDAEGQNVAIAGRTGFAHYSLLNRRWKLFGNETQEKDFVVTGGMLWWRSHIILGCYNLVANRDEVSYNPKIIIHIELSF